MSEINKWIKQVRLERFGERGKAKLCKHLEILPSTYQLYEGDTNPPYSFLKLFCTKLDIESIPLMNDKEDVGLIATPIVKSKSDKIYNDGMIEIWIKNDSYFLFKAPTYGDKPVFIEAFTKKTLPDLLKK